MLITSQWATPFITHHVVLPNVVSIPGWLFLVDATLDDLGRTQLRLQELGMDTQYLTVHVADCVTNADLNWREMPIV